MSGTTASISILKLDKTISTIFANYDGYLEHTGKTLKQNYSSLASVSYLIKCGNISGIDAEENLSNKKKALIFKTKKDYLAEVKYSDYNYLFKEEDHKWYLVKSGKLQLLSDALGKLKKKNKI